jgi:hypothetical protein
MRSGGNSGVAGVTGVQELQNGENRNFAKDSLGNEKRIGRQPPFSDN